MDYFDGLHFLHWTSQSEYTLWADRTFKDYYTLQYLKSGRITLRIDDEQDKVVTGPAAWFTFPGPRFRFGSASGEHWNHNYVAFAGPRADNFVQSGLLPAHLRPPAVILPEEQVFERDFMRLLSVLDDGSTRDSRAVHILEGLLLQLHGVAGAPSEEPPLRKEISRLAREISESPEKKWDFRKEAAELNVSYDYFRHQFKTCLRMSPGHYLTGRRLQTAGRLLRTTEHPVKQIAAAVGIADLYYFTRIFKRMYRLPPGRYRMEFRRNSQD